MLDIIDKSVKNIDFKKSILKGLTQPQKTISSEWFYDDLGATIFDAITKLPEYYPTRVEMEILQTHIEDLTKNMGPNVELIEFGSGSSEKTRFLFDNHAGIKRYIPIEISEAYLTASTTRLRQDYPVLDIVPKNGSFLETHSYPDVKPNNRRVGFFPGSTIGNLSDLQIANFLSTARHDLGDQSALIIGVDIRKSPDIIIPAYNDNIGVTAAFNLNLLNRINRDVGGNFDVRNFKHSAIWNDKPSRIEMHLESQIQHIVNIEDSVFHFEEGETILTEISRKFPDGYLNQLAAQQGWRTQASWTDGQAWFQLIQFEAA